MSGFFEIKPAELKGNPFEMIGKQWMLITAKKDDKINSLPASGGALGVIWNKNVATIYVRSERYTKEFIDNTERFSLTFFSENYRKELSYLGMISGKYENKIEKAGLTIEEENGVPYFKEAELVIICRKLYAQDLDKEAFEDIPTANKNYVDNNFHTMYIGEIEKILTKCDK